MSSRKDITVVAIVQEPQSTSVVFDTVRKLYDTGYFIVIPVCEDGLTAIYHINREEKEDVKDMIGVNGVAHFIHTKMQIDASWRDVLVSCCSSQELKDKYTRFVHVENGKIGSNMFIDMSAFYIEAEQFTSRVYKVWLELR